MPIPELLAGDCLLYRGNSLFDWLIYLKTWTFVCHVEVYQGGGLSVASRNGVGVNLYPLRTEGLAYVLRPKAVYGPFDNVAANAWFYTKAQGQGYDWKGLLCFTLAVKQGSPNKMFCSEFATRYYRAGRFNPFAPDYDADRISPGQFLQSPSFDTVYSQVQN